MSFNTLAGHFLIATPALKDPLFYKSVIYICQHDKEGALGVVINKTSGISYTELFAQMGIITTKEKPFSQVALSCGPVDIDYGLVLHNSKNNRWQSTLHTTGNIKLTSSKDILDDIAADNFNANYLIGLGYSGWSAGQLEEEIMENSWLTCPANSDIIFNDPIEDKFDKTCKLLGINWANLSLVAGHA